MKTKLLSKMLAFLLCLCMLLSSSVMAEETIEVIAEAVIPVQEAADEEPTEVSDEDGLSEGTVLETVDEEPTEVCNEGGAPALIEVAPLPAPEVIPQEGWVMGENDGLVIPCGIDTDAIVFNWTPVEGAVSYRIETARVSESGSAEDIQEIGTTAETSIALPVSEYGEGWYALGVIAEAEDGRSSACMQVFRLQEEIAEETAPVEEEEAAEDADVSVEATALRITQQPKSVKVAEGQKATVSVKAVGDGLTYAWFMKDPGDTGYTKSSNTTNTYSVPMNSTRDGRRLICYVYDKYGNSVHSNTVIISMGAPLKVVTQPKSVKVAEGQTATVSVKATGDGLSYVWYTREADADTYYKSSVTGNTYSVVMNSARNGRRLICYVYDAYGRSVQCNTVMISMGAPLKVITQPQSVTVAEGQKATVSVKASGDGLTYAWFMKDDGDTGYTKSSITTNTYSVVMNSTRNGRRLICYVYDAYGRSVQCNTVVIGMGTKLQITQQPRSVTVAEGQKATVTVQAVGDGLSYEWYTREADSDTYYKSSITGNTYSVVMNASRSGRRLICYVKDRYGIKLQCNTVMIKMGTKLQITQYPQNVTVAEGQTATVTVEARGDGVSYEWYTREANSDTYYKSSVSGNTYSVVMNSARNGRRLVCYVTDQYGTRIQCPTVMIKMGTKLRITQQPQDVTVARGATASISVKAEGDGLTYTWFASDVGDNDVFSQSATITGNTYSVTMNDTRNGRKVYCKITDAYGNSVTSNIAVLRMEAEIDLDMTFIYVFGMSTSTIEVSWEEVENAEGYYLYRSFENAGGPYTKIATFNSGSSTFYLDTGLERNSLYHYKVQAFADGGAVVAPMSDSDFGWTYLVNTPTISGVTKLADGQARIEWNFVEYADGYCLERTDENENVVEYDISADCNYYIDTDIESGMTYYYSVAAYVDVGDWLEYGWSSDAVEYTETSDSPVKYRALLIGNTYPGTINELNGPDNDVNAMYKMLSNMNASPYETSYVYNASASSIKNNISYAFSRADENDVSLFYYSGHGTSDGSLCGTDGAYVTVSQLRSALDAIPGKKIVILDSCYSGAHINKTYGDGSIDYSAFNDAVVSAFSAKNRTLTTNDYVVLTACSKTQTSLSLSFELDDGSDFWFGLLTYGVTEGSGFEMLGGSYCERYADVDNNDKITLGETYTYCVELVEALGYTQNTQYYGDTSFVLWKD